MRGPTSDYAAPPVYVVSQPAPQGIKFSATELRQLAVAILGLSAAFTVVLFSPILGFGLNLFNSPVADLGFDFGCAVLAVASGVGLHEIMHKIVAERYGLWAEFRYSLRGLLMAFLFAFAGVIFGAPGATYISGYVTPQQNSRISAAGPLTNIALGVAFFALVVLLYPSAFLGTVSGLLYILFQIAGSVNLVLAAFNMIPIMPLDGAKVWAWNKAAWVGILALAIGLLALGALSPQQYLFW